MKILWQIAFLNSLHRNPQKLLGGAAAQISDELKMKYSAVPWQVISGLRNRLTHRYFDVSWPIVWEIIETDIPALKIEIEQIITEEKYEFSEQ